MFSSTVAFSATLFYFFFVSKLTDACGGRLLITACSTGPIRELGLHYMKYKKFHETTQTTKADKIQFNIGLQQKKMRITAGNSEAKRQAYSQQLVDDIVGTLSLISDKRLRLNDRLLTT